jgi:hypothetical protein
MDESTEILFKEYADLLNFEGYADLIKAESPERYQFEFNEFTNSHIVFPLVYNFSPP